MKSLVVLSCVIAVAVASYVPADTPEVAAAKAQHFAAHQQAQARNWAQDVVVNRQWVAAAPSWNALWTSRAADWYAPSWQRWYNPAQISVVNGQVQDTPEVAAEKAKHFALYAEAQARSASAGGDDGEWVDDVHVVAAPAVKVAVPTVVNRNYVNYVTPGVSHVTSYAAPAVSHTWVAAARHHEPANIVVANGHVQDTPEVAAEKAKHLSLVAEAQARNAAAGSTEWADNVEAWKAWGSPAAVSTYAAVAPVVSSVYPSWTRVAQPAHVVVANGHVQDTPEVAAEKAKHLALVAQTKLRDAAAGPQVEWSDDVVAPVVAPAVYSRVAAVAPVAVAAAPVTDIHSQYHAQDEAGQYSYGYNGGLSTKNEEKTVDGVTRGAYSYVDANGLVQSRSYVADGLGFRVAATDLPQGPSPVNHIAPVATVYAAAPVASPAVHLVSKHYQPAQVVVKADGTLEDTPEVAAAKAQHFAAVQQEHARHAGW